MGQAATVDESHRHQLHKIREVFVQIISFRVKLPTTTNNLQKFIGTIIWDQVAGKSSAFL